MEADNLKLATGHDPNYQNGVHAPPPTAANGEIDGSSESAGGKERSENVVELDGSALVCSLTDIAEEESNAFVNNNGSDVADQENHSKVKGGKNRIEKTPSSNQGAATRARKSKDVDADVNVTNDPTASSSCLKKPLKSRSFYDSEPSTVKSGKTGGASPARDKAKGKSSRKGSYNKVEEDGESSPPSAGDDKPQRVGSLPAYNFSFKCDERAEKRKEFYSKLEQKIHAKEAEKTTLQAKSQESQEVELKMLRKSLNFKATPMPSFYQEPAPPKVELKKIPTTRAKSPKLGRKKSAHTSDSEESVTRPTRPKRLSLDAKAGQINHHKKPLRKSLPKLPSENTSANAKTDTASTAAPFIDPVESHPKSGLDDSHVVDDAKSETASTAAPIIDPVESLPISESEDAHVVDDAKTVSPSNATPNESRPISEPDNTNVIVDHSEQMLDQDRVKPNTVHEPIAS